MNLIQTGGSPSDDFYDKIINKLNEDLVLDEDELRFVRIWDKKVSQFHKVRIETIKNKLVHFINLVNNYVNKHLCQFLDIDIQCYQTRFELDICNQIMELNNQFNKWMKYKDTFKEDSEQKQKANRVYAFGNYFKAIANLLTTLGNPPDIPKTMSLPWNFTMLGLLGTLADNAYNYEGGNTTPFTSKLSELLKSWAQTEGITVKIEGKENIKYISLNNNKHNIINLFCPSHRSPIPDAMLLGHLNLPHYILCANLGSFLKDHPFLANKIACLPEVIGVGTIRGDKNMTPYEKIILSRKHGISPNVVNYPQGFVPSIGEVLPISPVFVEKLLTALFHNGFLVNIIPIAYEVESEFLFDKKDHTKAIYTIKYGKPLEFNAVKTLVQIQLGTIVNQNNDLCDELAKKDDDGVKLIDKLLSGKIRGNGPKCIDHYLLSFWYDNITEFQELTLVELIYRVNKRFGFNIK